MEWNLIMGSDLKETVGVATVRKFAGWFQAPIIQGVSYIPYHIFCLNLQWKTMYNQEYLGPFSLPNCRETWDPSVFLNFQLSPHLFVCVQGEENLAPRLTSSPAWFPAIDSWLQLFSILQADGPAVGQWWIFRPYSPPSPKLSYFLEIWKTGQK